MPKMIAIITARMGSTRLPGKVMLPLEGKPVIEHIIDRINVSNLFEKIVLATSFAEENEPLVELAIKKKICYFRGKEDDVLDRYYHILHEYQSDNFVRFCGDNPLADMKTTKRLVELHLENNSDYTCVKGLNLQLGLVEVYSRRAIEIEFNEVDKSDDMRRESVGIFLRENKDRFNINTIPPDTILHQSPFRITLDYEADYEFFKNIFGVLYRGEPIPYDEAIEYLNSHPNLASINTGFSQKCGNVYWEQLDKNMP